MKSLMLYAIPSLAALLPLGHVIGQSDVEQPKSIVEIVEGLESQGYGPFNEVSMDHRNWEVEVYKDAQEHELHVDPRAAKVVSDRLDD